VPMPAITSSVTYVEAKGNDLGGGLEPSPGLGHADEDLPIGTPGRERKVCEEKPQTSPQSTTNTTPLGKVYPPGACSVS